MAVNEQIKEITDKLENGIQELYDSDKYTAYLRTMSRFHRYSTRNTLLIHLQYPEASHVAGFQAWSEKFKRHVKKGEKGIRIFAPIQKKADTIEVDKIDPITKTVILDENGQAVKETLQSTKSLDIRFTLVSVFDIRQTDGEPLPQLAEPLAGNVEQYELFMDALRAVSPLPIEFAALDGSDGIFIPGDKIKINEGMSEIQTVSAAVHELAHARLYDQITALKDGDNPIDRSTEEVICESISYVVCQHYRIETGTNSLGYIADWSHGKELKELNTSLDIIRKTAAALIDEIDEQYLALAKARGIDLTSDIEKTENAAPPQVPEEKAAAVVSAEQKGASMEYSELQQKGFDIAKSYEHLPLQNKLNLIAAAFNCQTAKVETNLCRGKYRGYSDIYIKLDNGASLAIGMHRTPQAKTAKVQNECVNNTLARYNTEIVHEAKTLATAALTKREAADNAAAAQKGLKPYTFLNVELNDGADSESGGYLGWYYVTLAVDGKIFAFVETGLNYDTARGVLSEHSNRPHYFTAGGLRESDVDFVFNNVGHSSHNGSHQVHLGDAARERAERSLHERINRQMTAPQKAVNNISEHELYKKFADMFPRFMSREFSALHLDAKDAKPLTLEWLHGNMFAIMHTYDLNGETAYEPMVTLESDNEKRTVAAHSLVLSEPPRTDMVYNNGVANTERQQNINNLTLQWLNRAEAQRFIPISASLKIDGADTYVTIGKDGNPLLPDSGPDDRFYIDPQKDTVTWIYYNGNSSAGGQYVISEIPYSLIDEAHAAADNTEAFFDYFYGDCRQYLVDINTPEFAEADRHFEAAPYSFGGCTEETMNALVAEMNERLHQRRGAVDMQTATDEPKYTYPDLSIAESERDLYGYTNNEILPLTANRALALFDTDHTIYLLHENNTETMAFDRAEIEGFGGLFGIERLEWNEWSELQAMSSANHNSEASRESELLHGREDRFGIYQLKDGDQTRHLRFEPYDLLTKHGFELERVNYKLVYSAPLNGQDLDKIYENFNINRPDDFTGHSLSVSDVVVLRQNNEISAHYIDRAGFVALPSFTGEERAPESQIAPPEPALSQVGTSAQPTVAEVEADVKAGKSISIMDLAKATRAEKQQPAQKGKPSLLAKLETAKHQVTKEHQPDTNKKNERGYE